MKHQTPNTKHQRSIKLLAPNHSSSRRAVFLKLGVWDLSGVWCLVFGVSLLRCLVFGIWLLA
jgi:hypothetical protein